MNPTTHTKPATPHTPEPWEHANNGLIYGQGGDEGAEAPYVCDVIGDSAMQALGILSPAEEANARRICAAVNACQGIPTEVLEKGIIGGLLEALQFIEADINEGVKDRSGWLRIIRTVLAEATDEGRQP